MSTHAGFMVDKAEMGQDSSEYFGFPLPSLIPQTDPIIIIIFFFF
jgi:hypothetical protein